MVDMHTFKRLFIVSLLLGFLSCGKLSGEDPNNNPLVEEGSAAAISAGIAALSGAVQFGNDGGGGISSESDDSDFEIYDFDVLNTCGQPATTQVCNSGSRFIVYSNCPLPGGINYTGTVNLVYSNVSCLLDNIGNTVTRKITMNRTGFLNSTISTSTNPHKDYRGIDLGEGTRYTRTASGFLMDIFGVQKTRTTQTNDKVYDISIRTKSAMEMTGSLNGARTLNGGEVEVIHNLAKYVATFSPSGLQYNSTTCCHPTSGTLDVEYTGELTGTAKITFTDQCGIVEVERNNATVNLQIHGCE